jgi:hypothetical protein
LIVKEALGDICTAASPITSPKQPVAVQINFRHDDAMRINVGKMRGKRVGQETHLIFDRTQ